VFKLNMDSLRKKANCEVRTPANAANAANFSRTSDVMPSKLAGLAKLAGLPDVKKHLEGSDHGRLKLAGLAGSGDSTIAAAQAVGLMVNPTPATLATLELAALPDPDRWCWPHSSAMTGREIDTMVERTNLFNRRGLPALDAELLADKMVTRDREADERRLCLECAHLSRESGLRCAQWQRAGLGAPGIPAGLHLVLQRCDGFKDQTSQRAAP
jgi:hypothetical protein